MKLIDIEITHVFQYTNKFEDEVEVEIIKFPNRIFATANICKENPPFTDITGVGTDLWNKRMAVKKAIQDLHQKAYKF